jgi:hypothetical protein
LSCARLDVVCHSNACILKIWFSEQKAGAEPSAHTDILDYVLHRALADAERPLKNEHEVWEKEMNKFVQCKVECLQCKLNRELAQKQAKRDWEAMKIITASQMRPVSCVAMNVSLPYDRGVRRSTTPAITLTVFHMMHLPYLIYPPG